MDPMSNSPMESGFQSSNFRDLLNSQVNSPMNQAYSPMNQVYSPMNQAYSPMNQVNSPMNQFVDLDSSEVPQSRGERKKWSPPEDVVLCSAWLNTSKDAVVENEQRQAAFWKRVGAYYNASPKVVGFPKRDGGCCKQRWKKVNDSVSKYVGCYETARRQQRSGQSELK